MAEREKVVGSDVGLRDRRSKASSFTCVVWSDLFMAVMCVYILGSRNQLIKNGDFKMKKKTSCSFVWKVEADLLNCYFE